MGTEDKTLGGKLQWTSIQGEWQYPCRLRAKETGISSNSVSAALPYHRSGEFDQIFSKE